MHLYKRGEVWWLEYVDRGERRRVSTKCTDKKAAQHFLVKRQRDLADPTYAAAYQATVGTAASRFLREIEKTCRSDGTLNMYRCKAGHVARLLGDLRLSDLTHAKVISFTEDREQEGAAPYTVHREITTLRRILKSAARAREFSGDVKSVIPDYAARYTPRTRWLTEEDLIAVCAHLDPNRAATICFMVASGVRRREAFRAHREDVLATGIAVRGSKTARAKRLIPHVSIFWPLMAFALEHADGAQPLLLSPWINMRRDVHKACLRAGVEPFSANDLRRTSATWMVKRGVPLNLIAKFLGHASTLMLQKVYGQLDAADVGRLIETHVGR